MIWARIVEEIEMATAERPLRAHTTLIMFFELGNSLTKKRYSLSPPPPKKKKKKKNNKKKTKKNNKQTKTNNNKNNLLTDLIAKKVVNIT